MIKIGDKVRVKMGNETPVLKITKVITWEYLKRLDSSRFLEHDNNDIYMYHGVEVGGRREASFPPSCILD